MTEVIITSNYYEVINFYNNHCHYSIPTTTNSQTKMFKMNDRKPKRTQKRRN